jgi:hypothetical protein
MNLDGKRGEQVESGEQSAKKGAGTRAFAEGVRRPSYTDRR